MFSFLMFLSSVIGVSANEGSKEGQNGTLSETEIPEELEEIPERYTEPAAQQGTLEKLEYDTWESFSYEEHAEMLTKTAWVYLPYGYTEDRRYNVLYLSHGGWSDETTLLGTAEDPHSFKHIVDHAISDGKIQPLIIVALTYNNTSQEDAGDYGLAIRLTDNYHNELVNDLIPAVEGTYSTYAKETSPESLTASRDHRAFGGFSMGSINTWHAFEYCLDYFRYFMPMSGSLTTDGEYMADIIRNSGYDRDDFFIWTASGTDDFAYSAFKAQIEAMAAVADGTFRMADSEVEGNLSFRERKGGVHNGYYADEYTYNGLRFFWSRGEDENSGNMEKTHTDFTLETKITDVIIDPAFGAYGRLIFPADEWYYGGDTLENLSLTWYSNIDPEKTVEIVNDMKEHAEAGDTIFYDIYTDEEKAEDPEKADTGLFFFRGNPGEKFAICNAGGGFAYVGAMQDSFPHALELSKKGYNAFALIYRPGAQTACEDLARAIAFIQEHAEELEVDVTDYSLWGGSAGARMAAWLGSYGTESFGEQAYPAPAAVIMQYTGLSEVYGNEPPTYNCVGTRDGLANYRTMESRIRQIQKNGTDAEIEVFEGLSHGFGLGTGTVAEGWLDRAVEFWEGQMD